MTQSKSGDLPFHPYLTHPHTGCRLQAVGVLDSGRIVWPVIGASDDGGGDGKTDDGKKDDGGDTKSDDGKKNDDTGSGKPNGDADLHSKVEAQQKVNRDLEAKFNALKDGLKGALGIEDKKTDASELLAGLQSQLAGLQHDNLVSDVARRHGITEDDDIELLKSAKDEDTMKKLAARLKPTGDSEKKDDSGKPGRPKPDKSQGSSSGDGSGAKANSVAEVMAARRAARDAAKK